MMRPLPAGAGAALTIGLVLTLAGCGSDHRDDFDVSVGGAETGDIDTGDMDLSAATPTVEDGDRFVALTRDGAVKLGLNNDDVYFRLSQALRDSIEAAIDRDVGEAEGFGGWIGGMVQSGVGRALAFRVRYPLDEIRDVRYEDGELLFEFTDPDREIEMDVDGQPLTRAFTETDARAFVEAFREVKAAPR